MKKRRINMSHDEELYVLLRSFPVLIILGAMAIVKFGVDKIPYSAIGIIIMIVVCCICICNNYLYCKRNEIRTSPKTINSKCSYKQKIFLMLTLVPYLCYPFDVQDLIKLIFSLMIRLTYFVCLVYFIIKFFKRKKVDKEIRYKFAKKYCISVVLIIVFILLATMDMVINNREFMEIYHMLACIIWLFVYMYNIILEFAKRKEP